MEILENAASSNLHPDAVENYVIADIKGEGYQMFSKYELENGLLSKSYANQVVYPSTLFFNEKDSLVFLQNKGAGLYDYNHPEERLYFRPLRRPFASVIGPVIRWLKKREYSDQMISAFTGVKMLSMEEFADISAEEHFALHEKIAEVN